MFFDDMPFPETLNLSPTINGPNSEYYEKIINDHDVNKLIFPNDDKIYTFKFTDFEDKGTIGTSRSIVKKFYHKPSKNELAVKFVHVPHNRFSSDDENMKKLKFLYREIEIFRELKNEVNIVRFYGFCLHEGQALICMELMDFSLKDLFTKLIDTQQKFPEDLLGCIVVALLNALAACKTKNIIFRDVKPDNVLLNKNGAIKLCDFGESRILHDSLASTFAGAICYWPPERFEPERSKFDVRADIWSLGITLIEIVHGKVPYDDPKHPSKELPSNIILLQNLIVGLDTEKAVEQYFPAEDGYSEEARDFVKLCLKRIHERPKYAELKETKFYKKYENVGPEMVKGYIEKMYEPYMDSSRNGRVDEKF